MGLDQYLSARKFVSGYSFENEADKSQYKKMLRCFGIMPKEISQAAPTAEVKFNVAYWRKASAIHAFFVKEAQNGVDDCNSYSVSRELLQKLVDSCKLVLNDKKLAAQVLPTQSGVFFGSTDYDEGYFGDLEDTIKQVELVLNNPKLDEKNGFYFQYQSSW